MQHQTNFDSADLIAGIDTHADTHTLAILTVQGGTILTETFAADAAGYTALITALKTAGPIAAVGVEGTNSYGAGLSRALIKGGYTVKEVLRPARQVRRMNGKSDPIDAVEAARTVIAGRGVSDAKDSTTAAESLRFLFTARAQLVRTMTALSNSITSMLVTAPDTVRAKYRGMTTQALIARLAACRPDEQVDTPGTAALQAMRQLARARLDARSKADDLEEQMRELLNTHYPPDSCHLWRRNDHRRPPGGHRRRQPTPDSQRGSLRQPLRDSTNPRVLRPHEPAPSQPRRRPTRQQRTAPNHAGPDTAR